MSRTYLVGPEAQVHDLADTTVLWSQDSTPLRERVCRMLEADRVVLLPGWDKLQHCNVEQFIARCVGIPVDES